MPIINVDYDDKVVSEDEVRQLSEALHGIVVDATNIDDVNVYANAARIKVSVLPLEVCIRMSARLVNDETALVEAISEKLRVWKHANKYPHPINIYLIPMHWSVVSDI